MQSAFRSRILNNTDAGNRVDWGWRKQGSALPAIALLTISDPRPQHMGGNQATRQTLVQMDTWARTYAEARAVANAAIALVVPADDVGGVRFLRSFVEQDVDSAEDTDDGQLARVSVDIRVTHTIP
jgi:hypothetical protein